MIRVASEGEVVVKVVVARTVHEPDVGVVETVVGVLLVANEDR